MTWKESLAERTLSQKTPTLMQLVYGESTVNSTSINKENDNSEDDENEDDFFKPIEEVEKGDRYSLSQQVLNFESTLNQYRRMMNATTLSRYLAKSIAVVVSGSNDYISNYLLSALYSSSYNYNAQEFGNLLFNSYVRQILVFEC